MSPCKAPRTPRGQEQGPAPWGQRRDGNLGPGPGIQLVCPCSCARPVPLPTSLSQDCGRRTGPRGRPSRGDRKRTYCRLPAVPPGSCLWVCASVSATVAPRAGSTRAPHVLAQGAIPWGPVCSPSGRSAAAICFQKDPEVVHQEGIQSMEGDSGRGGVIGPLTLSFPADKEKDPATKGGQLSRVPAGDVGRDRLSGLCLAGCSFSQHPAAPGPEIRVSLTEEAARAVAAPRAPTGCVWTPSPSPCSQPLAHFVTSLK